MCLHAIDFCRAVHSPDDDDGTGCCKTRGGNDGSGCEARYNVGCARAQTGEETKYSNNEFENCKDKGDDIDYLCPFVDCRKGFEGVGYVFGESSIVDARAGLSSLIDSCDVEGIVRPVELRLGTS